METSSSKTKRLVETGLCLAISAAISYICGLLPMNLPFGGGFTIASMLTIILIAYRYGVKWGVFTGFVYSLIQMLIGYNTVSSFFIPSSDGYMALHKAIIVCLLDYVVAYTFLGFGGIFRDKSKSASSALLKGTILALSLKYLVHIISGTLFFGAWAEWFFTQEGFYSFGGKILDNFSGISLSVIYSVIYNGLYMIPEIILTSIVAVAIGKVPYLSSKAKA